MRKAHEVVVTRLLLSLWAAGLVPAPGCGAERSIELEEAGGIPDLAIHALEVGGEYLYATTTSDVLAIIDISTPEQPAVVGRIPFEDDPDRFYDPNIFLSDRYAYVAPATNILYIVDISEPSQPVEVGRYQAANSIVDTIVRDRYAYLVTAIGRLVIVDVSAPDTPVQVGELILPEYGGGVALNGAFAFVTIGNMGLFVADVLDPTAPREVDINLDPYKALDIEIRDDRAYILTTGGFAVMDVSNPSQTTLLSYAPVVNAERMAMNEDMAFVTKSWTVVALDLADPDRPRQAGKFVFENSDYFWITGVAASNEHVFTGRQGDSLAAGRASVDVLAILEK